MEACHEVFECFYQAIIPEANALALIQTQLMTENAPMVSQCLTDANQLVSSLLAALRLALYRLVAVAILALFHSDGVLIR